jgi:hypothetical protein
MQFTNHLENAVSGPVIQIPRRLIRQKQFGLADERSCDCDSLLFATGNLTNFMVQPVSQTNTVQNLTRVSLTVGSLVAADELRHHRILERCKFRQKMMELKDKPDVPVSKMRAFCGVPIEDILVFKEHITPRRRVQTAEQMKQGALSSTRRANYGDESAAPDFKSNVFENKNLRCGSFVDLREVSGLNHSYRSASTGWSREAAAEG